MYAFIKITMCSLVNVVLKKFLETKVCFFVVFNGMSSQALGLISCSDCDCAVKDILGSCCFSRVELNAYLVRHMHTRAHPLDKDILKRPHPAVCSVH